MTKLARYYKSNLESALKDGSNVAEVINTYGIYDWHLMELIYKNEAKIPWDRKYLDHPRCLGVLARKNIISTLLADEIKKQHRFSEVVSLLSLGCGSGRPELEALAKVKEIKISLLGIDYDKSAEAIFIETANLLEVGDRVKFRCLNLIDIKNLSQSSFNIITGSGFVEYLNDEKLIELLASIKGMLRKQGVFIFTFDLGFANFKSPKEHIKALEEIFGKIDTFWRNVEEMQNILLMSGFKIVSKKTEPNNIHQIYCCCIN